MKSITKHIWQHLFMYFFLAVQVLFLVWIIAGAQANHCEVGDQTAQNACTAGTGIGVALIIGLWVAVDIILGIGRLIVVLSHRHKPAPERREARGNR